MTNSEHPSPPPTLTLVEKLYAVHNINSLIPEKLDLAESNYSTWSYFFKGHCSNFGVLKHIEEPVTEASTSTPPTDEWITADSIVKSWHIRILSLTWLIVFDRWWQWRIEASFEVFCTPYCTTRSAPQASGLKHHRHKIKQDGTIFLYDSSVSSVLLATLQADSTTPSHHSGDLYLCMLDLRSVANSTVPTAHHAPVWSLTTQQASATTSQALFSGNQHMQIVKHGYCASSHLNSKATNLLHSSYSSILAWRLQDPSNSNSDDLQHGELYPASPVAMAALGVQLFFRSIIATLHAEFSILIVLLERAGMLTCNPCRTPVDTDSKLSADGDPVCLYMHDPREPHFSALKRILRYIRVGALNYFLGISVTRDSSGIFSHSHVCLYMHDPREPHFSALKWILQYVQGTLDYGLQLFSSTTNSLIAYSDVDWAGCPTTRRSTSGYGVFLGNNLLSWSFKRQPMLSHSSAEAEYRGVVNAVAKTCWIRNLLCELHTPLSFATIMYCDNVSAVYLSSNPVQHQRTKNIEIDIHFVRDLVATGQVRVLHVPSRFQYADIFTKGLPSALFEEFRTSLSVRCPPAPTVSRRVCMAQRPVLMIRPDV
ncbi:ribonuclease H-like domain-containing protein [Tanacetum coccineum]